MELIPILSTIILVATICTFILAIGAYILYKIRERKGEQTHYAPPSSVQAELVTPEETDVPVGPHYIRTSSGRGAYPGRPPSKEEKTGYYPAADEAEDYERRKKKKSTSRKFLKYTSEGYVPTEEDKNTGILKWR